jgi:DNA-binding beta-propeller fold protein YncE
MVSDWNHAETSLRGFSGRLLGVEVTPWASESAESLKAVRAMIGDKLPVIRAIGLALVVWTSGSAGLARAQLAKSGPATNPYPQRVEAPELVGGEWVNLAKPLSLKELRGRFVLLDFWTFCCINCMHVLPELKKLEHAYPNELVVVGVHSAKFEGEQSTENIREAALRYEIEHPVVNDAKMAIWQRYGARSWPTLVLIDPEGQVVWAANGERSADEIKKVIELGLPFYRAQGLLRPAPRPTLVESGNAAATALRFPGKVFADGNGGRIFVADSNHNRIVVCTLDGKLLDVVGSGTIGRADGAFAACSFHHPQGMALVGDVLYVADTENHLLRKVELKAKTVKTIAGTGSMGHAWQEIDSTTETKRTTLTTSLSNPWALWAQGADLYIAMAGMHQIWKMPLDESGIAAYAGSGRENITDGALLSSAPYDAGSAAFAQPSGLTSDGKQLFVADSEGSTVRTVPFDAKGTVQTLVGLTGTLFDFGDVDGTGQNVRLQHPLGVAWADGKLYIADTYNNRIKVIDVAPRSCRSVAGTGKVGSADAEEGSAATFNEPAGISAANGRLYVADTNNHAIRVVELAAPNRVSTLVIEGLTAPVAQFTGR